MPHALSLASLGVSVADLQVGKYNRLPECPLCHSKTGFSLLWPKGKWNCFKCKEYGEIGRESYSRDAPRINHKELQAKQKEQEQQRNRLMGRQKLFSLHTETARDALLYLESRAISKAVAKQCNLLYCPSWLSPDGAFVVLLYDHQKNLVAREGRYLSKTVEPKTRAIGDKRQGVFLTPGALDSTITICEGPLDAVSLYQMGVPALQNAVFENELSPADELTVAAAICEHAPDGAKAARALTFVSRGGNIFRFTAPSQSRPGELNHQTAMRDSGVTVCDCQAGNMGRWCWHKETAPRMIALVLNTFGSPVDSEPDQPKPSEPPVFDRVRHFERLECVP